MSTKLYVGNLPYQTVNEARPMAPRGDRGGGSGGGFGRQQRESRW